MATYFRDLWKGIVASRIEAVMDSTTGKQVLDGSHIMLTGTATASVALGQLVLQRHPANFWSFVLLSPAIAVSLLGVLGITAWLAVQGRIPVLMGAAYLGLTAFQAVLGAVFHQLPCGENRGLFTLVSSLLVLLITFLSTRGWFPAYVKGAMYGQKKEAKKAANKPDEDLGGGDEEASVYEDAE